MRERTARSVLIVEDNADQAETLRMLLSLQGHRLEIASSGPAAIDLARRLRAEHGQAMRIIAVSAYAAECDREQSLEAGCEVHLVKPADPGFIESLLG